MRKHERRDSFAACTEYRTENIIDSNYTDKSYLGTCMHVLNALQNSLSEKSDVTARIIIVLLEKLYHARWGNHRYYITYIRGLGYWPIRYYKVRCNNTEMCERNPGYNKKSMLTPSARGHSGRGLFCQLYSKRGEEMRN